MSERSEAAWAPSRAAGRPGLAELYVLNAAPLQRLAYLLTGDHHLAEDITQQAFIKFYGRYFNLRKSSAAAAYLRRTVVNLARANHRRRHVEGKYLEL
jgi:DNA-directed RNA polymerase specialized sigma24 family protein